MKTTKQIQAELEALQAELEANDAQKVLAIWNEFNGVKS